MYHTAIRLTALFVFAAHFGVFAQVTQNTTLTSAEIYDNPNTPTSSLACSSALQARGWDTLGKVPLFNNDGGVYTITGDNSTACGSCYVVTNQETGITAFIVGVDTSNAGFNVSQGLMSLLTNGESKQSINVSFYQLGIPYCGGNYIKLQGDAE